MPKVDIADLRKVITDRKLRWRAADRCADFKPRGLGWERASPELNQIALANAQRLMLTRMPQIFAGVSMRSAILGSPGGAPARPRRFDWRDRGVVGPVTDQRWCGSYVSFACAGHLQHRLGPRPLQMARLVAHPRRCRRAAHHGLRRRPPPR